MAWWTWDPFREMDAMRREISRVFDEYGSNRWRFPFSQTSFLPGWSARTYPLLNIGQDKDNVYVEAMAPGIDPGDLEVSVMRNQLTLSGEKKPVSEKITPEEFHRNERATGKFVRTISLPSEVDEGKVSAEYRGGLLRITLPKTAAAKPKTISVNVN